VITDMTLHQPRLPDGNGMNVKVRKLRQDVVERVERARSIESTPQESEDERLEEEIKIAQLAIEDPKQQLDNDRDDADVVRVKIDQTEAETEVIRERMQEVVDDPLSALITSITDSEEEKVQDDELGTAHEDELVDMLEAEELAGGYDPEDQGAAPNAIEIGDDGDADGDGAQDQRGDQRAEEQTGGCADLEGQGTAPNVLEVGADADDDGDRAHDHRDDHGADDRAVDTDAVPVTDDASKTPPRRSARTNKGTGSKERFARATMQMSEMGGVGDGDVGDRGAMARYLCANIAPDELGTVEEPAVPRSQGKSEPIKWDRHNKEYENALKVTGGNYELSGHGYELMALVTAWVDDVLCAFQDDELAAEFARQFQAEFKKVTGGGEPDWYIQCSFRRRDDGALEVGQEQLIERVLVAMFGHHSEDRIGVERSSAAHTVKLVPAAEDEQLDEESATRYRRVVGMLLWVYVCTRTDIGWALIQLCRHVASPGRQHETALKRLCRYLSSTRGERLVFEVNSTNSHVHNAAVDGGAGRLVASSDCGFASNYDMTSNEAFIITFGGAVVASRVWMIKQHLWSAHEGETVAASECAREVMYQRGLLEEMGFVDAATETTPLFVDNSQTVLHSQEVRFTDKAKHVRLRDWYVRERMINGEIRVIKAKGTDLAVDCLTKALPPAEHERHFPVCLGRAPVN
jgi:hypothetical protein